MKKNFPQDLNDWNEYRGMVHWFSPMVLIQTAKKVLDSTLFGQYADRRLVQAALDSPIDHETLIEKYCGGEKGICGDKDGSEIWVDYVADLGDGFDSTYSIAYMIGQKEMKIGAHKLPRADCLVMGGDQVYPDASRDEYKKRMLRPYRAAFPRTSKKDACHPKVFLIPGNHDWYDGLNLFLAHFCNGRDTPIGSWIASQKRSYFAVHLGKNWWVWGFDSQLGEDIDKPQADYFVAVAQKMGPEAKVILCASVPTWLKSDMAGDKKGQEEYYRALHYIASIIRNECSKAKIPLVISGDLHHYSRYVAKESATNFITAGGGGAFLHPTHHLKDTISTKWPGVDRNEDTLEIGTETIDSKTKKAFYPPQKASKQLALGNIGFPLKNWDFCFVLALLYWICALLMLSWSGYWSAGNNASFLSQFWNQLGILSSTPVFVLIAAVLILGLIYSAEIGVRNRKIVIGTLHGLVHIVVLLFGTALVSTTISYFGFQAVYAVGEILYFFGLTMGMLALGSVGGIVWGIYLTIVSWKWGDHSNGAFGAMRLDSYRHFIRLKIEHDRLTIFPIGIDESPKRTDWEFNPEYVDADAHQDTPAIISKKGLEPHLIEGPIVIDINDIPFLKSGN
ncbi:MAG: metallophosphoesterase [Acidobacteria bacterium]|jgi:3',5'-cyclic AMP phosphodiesterase CpdA|nr:metallophosphoesterase [Acidobacteriota bacterium]